MIINGTIPQATTFTFKMAPKAISTIRSLLGGVRSGSIVFDWSDIKRAAQAFSYNSQTNLLSVEIPQIFRIDPTIFAD